MRLSAIPTRQLRRILRATEREAGPDSLEVRVLRRELVRREQRRRTAKRRVFDRSAVEAVRKALHEIDKRRGTVPPV